MISPVGVANMISIWIKVMGSSRGSSAPMLNSSWKCVVAITFEQFAPRASRCFKTPAKRPAPSVPEQGKNKRG